MKPRSATTSYDMYFRASRSKTRRVHPQKKRLQRAHTRKVPLSRIFDIPDEQMSEPPVVPKDERKIWH
jgi:hypothetical protein